MYNTFFGFKEKPFTLNPDPEYIFLSKSHEDVLSHLTYSIHEGNGFAKITGRVGSGKTLLCRTFLESLDQSVNSAYIFNPKLDSIQLLKTINDEFGIDSQADNIKTLTDELTAFLIKQKTESKKAVLIIDEAQDLSIEALEQIRLLSNLETVKSKLLLIILVGQSELNTLLEKYELRQLAQRISLSCELASLSFSETNDYIIHRLHIASRRRGDLFAKDTVKKIFEYSKGIPRLINIICDRMLLTAFSNNSKYVTKKIAKITMDEILRTGKSEKSDNFKITITVSAAALLVIIFFFFIIKTNRSDISSTEKSPVRQMENTIPQKKPINLPQKIVEEKAITPPDNAVEKISVQKQEVKLKKKPLPVKKLKIKSILSEASAITAAKDIIKLWDIDFNEPNSSSNYSDPNLFFISIGQYNNFMVKKLGNNINLLKKLNLPAVLEFNPVGSDIKKFVVLTEITENQEGVILKSGKKTANIPIEELYKNNFSYAYVFWKNFFNIVGTPPVDTLPSSVSSLKILLKNVGFNNLISNYEFNDETDEAIRSVQRKHNINQDGVVGSLTKIILYNELGTLDIPHIRFEKETNKN
ncbi:MAG: AAA family ATPase [Deltaproteobacteria bacterium]|nr:AAA family ATPase [Deltaproteobacteria bacterium]